MTPKQLLASVDHLRIWGHLTGVTKLGVMFRSPFRVEDKSPGCKLGLWKGDVKFFDKSRRITWDIIEGYKAKYPQKTWDEVCADILFLNGTSASTTQQLMTGSLKEPKVKITPIVGPWTPQGLLYWEKRGVTREMLDDPQTLTQQITGYLAEGENETGPFSKVITKRGFVYWVNGKPKMYFSYEEKGRKFKGHLRNDDVWLLKRHPEGLGQGPSTNDTNTLLISKSNKDLHVWRKFVRCDLMTVQAEGSLPSLDFLLTNVRIPYKRVVIVFDPDPAGIEGANKLQNQLQSLSDIGTFVVKVWNWPDLETKDLDKYREVNGYKKTSDFLWKNGFYNIFDT